MIVPVVSVVIPTRYRPQSVVLATRSALGQTLAPYEVIVVVDGPDPTTVQALQDIDDPRVIIIELTENGGAARARNIGVDNSRGDWIAFLDDDDEWLPGKLEAQGAYAASSEESRHIVMATGVERRSDSISDYWPLRSPSVHERVCDYLFVRRRPGEGFLQTSTIMLQRDLALSCPFPEHLRIHEDYDWFIELEKAGALFIVVLETLVVFNTPSARISLSSNAAWDTSLAWALSRRGDLSARSFSDFCLTEVARTARANGGVRAAVAVFLVASTGRVTLYSGLRFLSICFLSADLRRRAFDKVTPKRT